MPRLVTRETSAGRVTLDWGFNRWALVELGNTSLQRQVSSMEELGRLLYDSGVPATEAFQISAQEWVDRPSDVAKLDPSFARSAGRGAGIRVRLIATVAVLAAFVPFLAWYLPSCTRHVQQNAGYQGHGPPVNRKAAREDAARAAYLLLEESDRRAALRALRRLEHGEEYVLPEDLTEIRREQVHPVAILGPCPQRGDLCFRIRLRGDVIPDYINSDLYAVNFGNLDVSFFRRGSRPELSDIWWHTETKWCQSRGPCERARQHYRPPPLGTKPLHR